MNKKLVYIISLLICCINVSNVFANHFDDILYDASYDKYKDVCDDHLEDLLYDASYDKYKDVETKYK
jgi:hypothetical protein